MCSQFLKKMENYQGDLADIVRATANNGRAAPAAEVAATWQFPTNTIQYPSDPVDDFGDPFTYTMRDPLMQYDLDSSASGFSFYNSKMVAPPPLCDSRAAAEVVAPLPSGAPILAPNTLQISSPRNTGLKRRKSQAKKVVCIPAPAPANSRSTGEVVPSDLWAWRKYGQKPIKGSPYPRGYYRCSSSKGCPARKQVERSRTDPNMLVITYTSEHNHPWPTQRNALAGSTRSQPSKNTQKHDKILDDEDSAQLVKQETDQDFELMDEIEPAGFPETYKPSYEDSFFADLGEINEADSSLFTEGFSGTEPGQVSTDLDPFSFCDWANNGTATTTAAAYGDSKMGN